MNCLNDVRHIRLRHVGICLMFSTDFLILMFQCWILSTPGWIEIEIELRIGLKWFGGLSWESWPPLNCGSSWTFLQMFCHARWMSFWKDMMFVPYQVWCGPLGPSHSLEICTYPGHILTYSDTFWPSLAPSPGPCHPRASIYFLAKPPRGEPAAPWRRCVRPFHPRAPRWKTCHPPPSPDHKQWPDTPATVHIFRMGIQW